MQRPPGSSPQRGGRPGRGGGQACGRGQAQNRGQGRGQGKVGGGVQSQGRGQSHGEGQGQVKSQVLGQGRGQSEGQDQVNRGQVRGGGRSRGGRHVQNRGQMHQPSAQIPPLLPFFYSQNTFQNASQVSHPWLGQAVGPRHPMAPQQAHIQARSQVPHAASVHHGATITQQSQKTITHAGSVGSLPASNSAVGIRYPGHTKAQVVREVKQVHNNPTVDEEKSGAEKKPDGQHCAPSGRGRGGRGRGGRGRGGRERGGRGRGVGSSNIIPSLLTSSTMGTHQDAWSSLSVGQPATPGSQTVVRNKGGVCHEGNAAVRRNRRERGRYRVRGRGRGSGSRGAVQSTAFSDIASTIARGLASPVLSSLGKLMKDLFLKENKIGEPTAPADRSETSKGNRVGVVGEACFSSPLNEKREIDSRSLQRPVYDDQSLVSCETSEWDSVSESSSCVLEEQDNEEEGILKSEEIFRRSTGLSNKVQQRQRVGGRFRLRGALRAVRGGLRRRAVPQPSRQNWAGAPLQSDEVMIDVCDELDTGSQTSEVEGWIDVGDWDEIRFGDANPHQQTMAMHSKDPSESQHRRHDIGLGKNQAAHCKPYFAAQEVNPDVETLWRTKIEFDNSQNALDDLAQRSRTDQSVTLTEERKVAEETKQQQTDRNRNKGQGSRIKSAGDRNQQETTNVAAFTLPNSRPSFKVEQNSVINFLVNRHKESCTLFDVQNNSGLFPCVLQSEQVLHSLGFCRLIRVLIDPLDIDNSSVKVYMKKLRLCVEYRPSKGCTRSSCQYIHLCKYFLMDCCFSPKCILDHNVESDHNMKIMVECGIEIFNAVQKLLLIRCSNLVVCREHNRSEGCPVPNTCFKIHVCNSYILNKCLVPSDRCPQGHDLFSERNMKILRLCEVDQLQANFLLRMIVGFHNEPFNKDYSSVMREQQKASSGRTKPAGDNKSFSGGEQVSEWLATEQKVMDRSAGRSDENTESYKSGKRSNSQQRKNLPKFCEAEPGKSIPASSGYEETQREELSLKEASVNDCCQSFEEHSCDQMENCTERHGSQSPYLWRVRLHAEWFDLDNNELIEEEFSNPDAERFWGTMWDTTVCIDFSTLMSEIGAIQRLSTPSYAVCRDKTDATRWLWYWLDSTGKWILYGQNNEPPYQDVLESKFLRDSRHVYCCQINGINYELDFATMEQRNMQTNFSGSVRRRPFYQNAEAVEMASTEYHFDESKVPFGWAPMDTESKHGMELVPLHLDDANYETIKCNFFATLRAMNFEIRRIYRLQNLDLWQGFQMKKIEMEKKTGSHVEEVYVYHGTPEEETIRWICSLGFDQRMHGRHGAKYGTGVYFATTAKYSNCYTQLSERGLRYMFCARVMVGRTVEGKSDYRRPPPIDPMKPTEGLYDTCVDSTAKPSIYVIFDNKQSYPEYLIEYRDVVAGAEAGAHQSHPAFATASSASQYSRTEFNAVMPSSAHLPYSAASSASYPAYASDFSSPCVTALPNQFYGQPASFASPPSGYQYPGSVSDNRSYSAGQFPYVNAPPTTSYPYLIPAPSVPSYHSSISSAPCQPCSDDSRSHVQENQKNCHIM